MKEGWTTLSMVQGFRCVHFSAVQFFNHVSRVNLIRTGIPIMGQSEA